MKPRDLKYTLKWGYKKWRIEKDFQKEIVKNLEKEWYITFHPTDIGYLDKFLDLHFISPVWDIWWIEFKKIEKDSFNVKDFEDSQIFLLPKLEKIDSSIAKVFIYSVKHNDYKIFNFSELWLNKNDKWGVKIFTK